MFWKVAAESKQSWNSVHGVLEPSSDVLADGHGEGLLSMLVPDHVQDFFSRYSNDNNNDTSSIASRIPAARPEGSPFAAQGILSF